MVRESLFNIVGELVAGTVAIDLFAGSGSLGLEALSRGAERAIFVEKDRENVGLIHRNIATLRYEDRTQVRHADAYRWARTFQPAPDQPVAVFLDPPYREYEVRRSAMNQLLTGLVGKLPGGSLLAVEAGRGLDEEILADLAAGTSAATVRSGSRSGFSRSGTEPRLASSGRHASAAGETKRLEDVDG